MSDVSSRHPHTEGMLYVFSTGVLYGGSQGRPLRSRRQRQPEAEAIIAGGVVRIREKLNPEQQKRLDILYHRLPGSVEGKEDEGVKRVFLASLSSKGRLWVGNVQSH